MAQAPLVTPRKCIFCGSRKKITREHVVPDWIRKVIPRKSDTRTHSGLRFLGVGTPNVTIVPFLNPQRGNSGNRKLFMVCHACNTGWMKDLQDELIPLLTPLMRGNWEDFTEAAASRIAVWAAMTVSVIAMSYRDSKGVTTVERKFIRENRAVPPNWLVWIGRASGFEDVSYSNRAAWIVLTKDGINRGEPNTTVTTIVLGQLLIHAISVPDADLLPRPLPYGLEYGVLPVHPWGGGLLDWRFIPVIRDGSAEFARLKDDFFKRLMSLAYPRPPA